MRRIWAAVLTGAALMLAGAGCNFQTYKAVPLAPQAVVARFRRRSLTSSGLRAYLRRAEGHPFKVWPLRRWTPRLLTLAALYYNPQLKAARAGIGVARAGLITARERPNPVLSAGAGYATFPHSPWALHLGELIPWELAGQRKARERIARRQIRAARLAAAGAAWRVRSQLRMALLRDFAARRQARLLVLQSRQQARRTLLLRQRWQAGEIARPAYLASQRSLLRERLALEQARSQVRQARIALAAAIGIPAHALRGQSFAWPGLRHPLNPKFLPRARLRRWAEFNRLDLRLALENYRVAEARLRSQIALQYPAFSLGPQYSYGESQSVIQLALSLVLPILNHNQGPVAQALARRNQLAAAFAALQARDRVAAVAAREQYASAWSIWRTTRAAARLAVRQRWAAGQIWRHGQTGRLRYNQAQLAADLGAQAQWQALMRAQSALGALENAVQRPVHAGRAPGAARENRQVNNATQK